MADGDSDQHIIDALFNSYVNDTKNANLPAAYNKPVTLFINGILTKSHPGGS